MIKYLKAPLKGSQEKNRLELKSIDGSLKDHINSMIPQRSFLLFGKILKSQYEFKFKCIQLEKLIFKSKNKFFDVFYILLLYSKKYEFNINIDGEKDKKIINIFSTNWFKRIPLFFQQIFEIIKSFMTYKDCLIDEEIKDEFHKKIYIKEIDYFDVFFKN